MFPRFPFFYFSTLDNTSIRQGQIFHWTCQYNYQNKNFSRKSDLTFFRNSKSLFLQVKDEDGKTYSHQEVTKNGRTEGQYEVQLPDGRVQIVKYYADETGFHPEIIYGM